VTPERWVLVGERIGKSQYRLELDAGYYKKFYLLVATFVDNHDMYTRLGEVTVRGPHQVLRGRPLYMPGDVDWWERRGMAETMDTVRYGRPDRFGLLPLLKPEHAFWTEGPPPDLETHSGALLGNYGDVAPSWRPPSFPHPEYWANCRVLRAPNCNFNVIEIDLGEPMPATSLSLSTEGICPGFGLYGVVAETSGGLERLDGTPWLPPPRFREPIVLFDIRAAEDLADWTLEGAAYGEAIGVASLNTLVEGGEQATGHARSPAFDLPGTSGELVFDMHGGRNKQVGGEGNLVIRVRDVETGEVVGIVEPSGTHHMQARALDVTPLGERRVRLEMVDENRDASFAWIGLRRVSFRPK
jgi:hypothetical protein